MVVGHAVFWELEFDTDSGIDMTLFTRMFLPVHMQISTHYLGLVNQNFNTFYTLIWHPSVCILRM